MRKYLRFFVVMFALVMQSSVMYADDPEGTAIVLTRILVPSNGNPKPTKQNPPVSLYLNETTQSIDFYGSENASVTYYIYDEEEQVVSSGNILLSEQGQASVNVGMLCEGTYTVFIIVDGVAYEGEFEK